MISLIILLAIVAYILVALHFAVRTWNRAATSEISYKSAWARTLLVSLPFLLLGLNRAVVWMADRDVDRLCALDGGVHVYEVIPLGSESFGPDGTVFPQYRLEAARKPGSGLPRYGPDYRVEIVDETLRDGYSLFVPRLTRTVIRLERVQDEKLLSESIMCYRYGGDLPGPWANSAHSCVVSLYQPDFDRMVFVKAPAK